MALLDASEIDALAAASTPSSSATKPALRTLPFSVGRGDHEVTRGLAALDTHVPLLRRRLRERLRHQTRQQIELDDAAPRARTVEELVTQHPHGVIAELGGGMGLPPGFIVLSDTSARALALASMGVRSSGSSDDGAPITPGELRLLGRLLHVITDDVGEVLPKSAPGQPVRFLRTCTDPRLITSTGSLLSLSFVLRGDVDATIDIALPPSWLVRPKPTTRAADSATPKRPRRRIGDDPSAVVLGITAELGRAPMTLRKLLALVPGDVVHLLSSPQRPVSVLVQGQPRLSARPEIKDGRVVVVVDSGADLSLKNERAAPILKATRPAGGKSAPSVAPSAAPSGE